MAALTFAFDAQKGETPQSLAQKRAYADALMARRRTPQNIGEGFASMMQGLVSGMYRREADRAEAGGNAAAQSQMNSFYGNNNAAYFPPAPNQVPQGSAIRGLFDFFRGPRSGGLY